MSKQEKQMNEIIFWNDNHIHFCEIILDFGTGSSMKNIINEHITDPPLLT